MPRTKRRCGLCGNTKKLTKTECCDNWICDDEDQYVLFSYALNSCYRNHHRYTLCAYHFIEGHKEPDWRTCTQCKSDFKETDYEYYTTNDFNFDQHEETEEEPKKRSRKKKDGTSGKKSTQRGKSAPKSSIVTDGEQPKDQNKEDEGKSTKEKGTKGNESDKVINEEGKSENKVQEETEKKSDEGDKNDKGVASPKKEMNKSSTRSKSSSNEKSRTGSKKSLEKLKEESSSKNKDSAKKQELDKILDKSGSTPSKDQGKSGEKSPEKTSKKRKAELAFESNDLQPLGGKVVEKSSKKVKKNDEEESETEREGLIKLVPMTSSSRDGLDTPSKIVTESPKKPSEEKNDSGDKPSSKKVVKGSQKKVIVDSDTKNPAMSCVTTYKRIFSTEAKTE